MFPSPCKGKTPYEFEHSILRYDFIYYIVMYLFQVLPLLHWISEFSKGKDYNVFQPSLPSDLTHQGASIIHMNGTSPSECRNSLCWHTKGHLWIEGCLKHYRWAYYELHLSSIQLVIFTFEYVKCCTCLFLYATHVCTCILLNHVACCT